MAYTTCLPLQVWNTYLKQEKESLVQVSASLLSSLEPFNLLLLQNPSLVSGQDTEEHLLFLLLTMTTRKNTWLL